MKTDKGSISRLAAFAAVAALAFFWRDISGFLAVEDAGPPAVSPPAGREFTITAARFLRVGPDGVELEVEAGRVVKKRGRPMRLERIRARRPGGHSAAGLVAASGTYDARTGVLTLAGGVTIRTADGYVARTPAARYLARQDRISGRRRVEMTGPSLRVRGESFDFFPGRGVLRISGRVVCRIDTEVQGES